MSGEPVDLAALSPEQKRALLAQLLRDQAAQTPSWFPLSHGQRALWFLYQLAPESAAYNVAYAARIRSGVEVPLLVVALQALIDRHAILRSTYATREGEPMRLIHSAAKPDFEVVEAASWGQGDVEAWRLAETNRPFELEQGPVLRARLLLRSPGEHVLMLIVHHIAVDFWSLDVILDDLRIFYAAAARGEPVPAGPAVPPLEYSDYVTWQADALESAEGRAHWVYWKARLAGDLPVVALPTDRPRPALLTYRGALHHFELAPHLVREIKALARAEGTTPFVVVLAAYQAFLWRYSGQEDVIVGSPMAGRSLARLEETVGHFVNPAVLRTSLSGNPTFREAIGRTRETVVSALPHADLPFSLLVERLQPPRDLSRSPVFQHAFAWDKQRRFKDPLAGELKLDTIAMSQGGAQFDLLLIFHDHDPALSAAFQYSTDLFDRDTIGRMTEHFETLLDSAVAGPDLALNDLSLSPPAERQRLLVEWNDTRRDYPPDPAPLLFERIARRSPDDIAVAFNDDRLSYGELDARTNRLARHLQRRGVGPETLVGLCLERSLEMVVGVVAILKAGGAFVPLDPTHPPDRLSALADEVRSPVWLTQARFADRLGELPLLRLDSEWSAVTGESADPLESPPDPDTLAYVIYTSGSTGTPKAAMNTHAGLTNRLLWAQDEFRLTETDRVLQKTPLSFDVSVWELLWPLVAGARMVVAAPDGHRNSAYLVRTIVESGITTAHFVPSMLRVFLADPGVAQCTSLRRVLCSGEPLSAEMQERFFEVFEDVELHNLYGPAEAAIDVTAWRCRRDEACATVPIGRPVANTRVYVLDTRRQPTPLGVPGQLHIGGVQVGRGYLDRPDTTAQTFLPDPFADEPDARMYATGDLVRHRPDGNLEFLARLDGQVKLRGVRIELGEVEAALRRHEAVQECVAMVREDRPDDPRLAAYYVTEDLSAPSVTDLRGFLEETLPSYMIPSVFVRIDALPLTTSGKIDRLALPAPDTARPDLGEPLVLPRTGAERVLAGIWTQVLGLDEVGVHDSFFALGGASTQSLQVATLAQEQGLPLTPESIFQHQTIAELARAYGEPRPIPAPDDEQRTNGEWNTIIESLGVHLPPKEVSTSEVLRGCRRPVAMPLERLTGIRSRRVAETSSSIDLAVRAVNDCLARSKHDPADIDLLISSNISRCEGPSRFWFEPSTALQLRKRFGFHNALAFDITNACAGVFTAILVADAYLKGGLARCAMVVSGEYITHLTSTAQKEISGFLDKRLACLTLGDAGAALVLERAGEEGIGFHEIDLYTLSRYANLCVAKASERPHGGAIMLTDSIRQTAIAVKEAVGHAVHVMQRARWAPEDVDHLIMHQTSETSLNDAVGAINKMFKRKAAHSGNTVFNLSERGNTATTTHLVALYDGITNGRIKAGDNVFFGITGSGQTIGAARYTLDALPDRIRSRTPAEPRPTDVPVGPERIWCPKPPPGRRAHIVNVAVTGGHEGNASALDLAKAAATSCVEGSGGTFSDLDLVLYAGVYRDGFLSEPAMATFLAGDLGINDCPVSTEAPRTLAFDVMNGGLGFLNACHVATQLISVGRYRKAMVVTAEIENNARVLPERPRGVAEAGSAVILSESESGRSGFGRFAFASYPEYSDALVSATRHEDGRTHLQVQEDPRLDDHYLRCIPGVVSALLAAEDLDLSRMSVILPPQRSPSFLARLRTLLEIDGDRLIASVGNGKDLFTSSLGATLSHVRSKKQVQSGDLGLVIDVGAGVQVGCAIYRF